MTINEPNKPTKTPPPPPPPPPPAETESIEKRGG